MRTNAFSQSDTWNVAIRLKLYISFIHSYCVRIVWLPFAKVEYVHFNEEKNRIQVNEWLTAKFISTWINNEYFLEYLWIGFPKFFVYIRG